MPLVHACSFCKKTSEELGAIFVAGDKPDDAAICNECVALCVQLLSEKINRGEKIAEKVK